MTDSIPVHQPDEPPLQIDNLCQVVGEPAIVAMVNRFYQQVPNDDILGPMYPEQDLKGAEQRLADFLVYRMGGSTKYVQERGHPRLRMRHIPFAVTPKARDRWMELMTRAVEQGEFPQAAQSMLLGFFQQIATFMINRPE